MPRYKAFSVTQDTIDSANLALKSGHADFDLFSPLILTQHLFAADPPELSALMDNIAAVRDLDVRKESAAQLLNVVYSLLRYSLKDPMGKSFEEKLDEIIDTQIKALARTATEALLCEFSKIEPFKSQLNVLIQTLDPRDQQHFEAIKTQGLTFSLLQRLENALKKKGSIVFPTELAKLSELVKKHNNRPYSPHKSEKVLFQEKQKDYPAILAELESISVGALHPLDQQLKEVKELFNQDLSQLQLAFKGKEYTKLTAIFTKFLNTSNTALKKHANEALPAIREREAFPKWVELLLQGKNTELAELLTLAMAHEGFSTVNPLATILKILINEQLTASERQKGLEVQKNFLLYKALQRFGRDLQSDGLVIFDKEHPKGQVVRFIVPATGLTTEDKHNDSHQYTQVQYALTAINYLQENYQITYPQLLEMIFGWHQGGKPGSVDSVQRELTKQHGYTDEAGYSRVSYKRTPLQLTFAKDNSFSSITSHATYSRQHDDASKTQIGSSATTWYAATKSLNFAYQAENSDGVLSLPSGLPLTQATPANFFRRTLHYIRNNPKKLLFGTVGGAVVVAAAVFFWPAVVATWLALTIAAAVGGLKGITLTTLAHVTLKKVIGLFRNSKKVRVSSPIEIPVKVQAARGTPFAEAVKVGVETEILIKMIEAIRVYCLLEPKDSLKGYLEKLHLKPRKELQKELQLILTEVSTNTLLSLYERFLQDRTVLGNVSPKAFKAHVLSNLAKGGEVLAHLNDFNVQAQQLEARYTGARPSPIRILTALKTPNRAELMQLIGIVRSFVGSQDWDAYSKALVGKNTRGLLAILQAHLLPMASTPENLAALYKHIKTVDRDKAINSKGKTSEKEKDKAVVNEKQFSPQEIDRFTRYLVAAALHTDSSSTVVVTPEQREQLARAIQAEPCREIAAIILAVASQFSTVEEIQQYADENFLAEKSIDALQADLRGLLLIVVKQEDTLVANGLKKAFATFPKGNQAIFMQHVENIILRNNSLKKLADLFKDDKHFNGNDIFSGRETSKKLLEEDDETKRESSELDRVNEHTEHDDGEREASISSMSLTTNSTSE